MTPAVGHEFAFDLAHIWAGLIAFAVLAYVVLDGFDLGLGILFPAFPEDEDRTVVMNTIAPVWDGNETWLILGGGGLMAAFPLAFGVVMTALYAPIIAMLLGLVFRGVAFEFRFLSRSNRKRWETGFFVGSTVAAFAQGVALGALLQGVKVSGRVYAGGWWDWATPFSLLTGLGVVAGYALLGATWLILRTTGEVQERARGIARIAMLATLAAIVAVSLWTPFLEQQYWRRWFTWPSILYAAPVPVLVALAAWRLWDGLRTNAEASPFLAALALFVLSYVGLGVSVYPAIVPPGITIRGAASPDASLSFLLVGAAVLIPLILAYTAYSYWVFRAKVTADAGYH